MDNAEALKLLDKIKGVALMAGDDPWMTSDVFDAYEKLCARLTDPGYVRVPVELTAENGAKAALMGEFSQIITTACPECCGEEDDSIRCDTCDGGGEIELNVDISWVNIKKIYKSAIQHFAAATKETSHD